MKEYNSDINESFQIEWLCKEGNIEMIFPDGFKLKLNNRLACQIAFYIMAMIEVTCGKGFIVDVYKTIDNQAIIDGIKEVQLH